MRYEAIAHKPTGQYCCARPQGWQWSAIERDPMQFEIVTTDDLPPFDTIDYQVEIPFSFGVVRVMRSELGG